MEKHSYCKNWNGTPGDVDFSSKKGKELLKRFSRLSEKEKKHLLNSICKNKKCAEETNEAFETIIALLKSEGDSAQVVDEFQVDDDGYEEDEESEEETDASVEGYVGNEELTSDSYDEITNDSYEEYKDITIKSTTSETKDEKELQSKLFDLFKAIYAKDPLLEKIKSDAFSCMKGKICFEYEINI